MLPAGSPGGNRGPSGVPGLPDVSGLALTGERTLPGIGHENYWYRRHEAGYRAAARFLAENPRMPPAGVLLEAGAGEGYGAALLAARTGARVLALDYDPVVLAGLPARHPGVAAVRANLVALPLGTATVAAVVSLQTVEHLWDQPGFLAECARVLRPGGRLVLSTPNRRTFPPGNPFHARELDAAELAALVRPPLAVRRVAGLAHGPRLAAWEARHGSLVDAQLATPPTEWPASLRRVVAAVRAGDFVATNDTRGALDLLLLAEHPAGAGPAAAGASRPV